MWLLIKKINFNIINHLDKSHKQDTQTHYPGAGLLPLIIAGINQVVDRRHLTILHHTDCQPHMCVDETLAVLSVPETFYIVTATTNINVLLSAPRYAVEIYSI